MTLEQVVHRIATDSAFAAAMHADPEAALRKEGARLDHGEFEALLAALRDRPGDRPNSSKPWYETQLAHRPNDGPIPSKPWYEVQFDPDPA